MGLNNEFESDRECSETEMKGVVFTAISLLGGLIFLGVGLIVVFI